MVDLAMRLKQSLSDQEINELSDMIDELTRKAYRFGAANEGRGPVAGAFIEFNACMKTFKMATGLNIDAAHHRWEKQGKES